MIESKIVRSLKLRHLAVAAFAAFLCITNVASAAFIVVGTHVLLPNTPNQPIDIFVTGGEQIQGVNLNAQIGDDPTAAGTPIFQFDNNQHLAFPGPNLSTLIRPGSVFSPPAGFGENDMTFYPALWQSSSTTSSGTVAANGLLATLYVDTTAISATGVDQVWSLNLFDTIDGPTDWAGSIFQGNAVPNPTISDGFIVILGVPEPTSMVLAMLGAAGVGMTMNLKGLFRHARGRRRAASPLHQRQLGSMEPLEDRSLLSAVVGRHLFYNDSGTSAPLRYDGNNPAINANDDLAIASNKSALLPGMGAATFANLSSYSKGINGIMIDISGGHGTITAADFVFRVGNNNTPSTWAAAPAPNSISVRAGAGVGGSDRVTLTWANGAIAKKWLEVIVLANANTGLPQKPGYPVGEGDVFFFGSAVADTGAGNTATQANVSVTDELGARNNPVSIFNNVSITNIYDFNRDAKVNGTDALLSRNNVTSIGNVTRFITIANPPAAPEFEATDTAPVVSALAVGAPGLPRVDADVPPSQQRPAESQVLSQAPLIRHDAHLVPENSARGRALLMATEQFADQVGVDEELFESLLAGLVPA